MNDRTTSFRGIRSLPPRQQVTVNYHWEDGSTPPSHTYNAPRLLQICRELGAHKVLDLGCGNGALSKTLAEGGFKVVGCDVDPKGIAIARELVPSARFSVMGAYDDPLGLGDSAFDVVVCAEVIEHMYIPGQIPRFARQVLHENGHLVVSTPYHGYLKNLAISLCNRWDFHHTSLEDGGHIKFFSPKTFVKLLNQEKFEVVQLHFVGRFRYFWNGMIAIARPSR